MAYTIKNIFTYISILVILLFYYGICSLDLLFIILHADGDLSPMSITCSGVPTNNMLTKIVCSLNAIQDGNLEVEEYMFVMLTIEDSGGHNIITGRNCAVVLISMHATQEGIIL